MPVGVVLNSDSRPSARHQQKLQDHRHMVSVAYSVPV